MQYAIIVWGKLDPVDKIWSNLLSYNQIKNMKYDQKNLVAIYI